MKKIIFFILFTFLANAQDYSKLFNSLDSVQKSDAVNHLSKIKKLINYEILKSGVKIKEKEFVKGVFFIGEKGKLSTIIIDENSKKYENIISNVISNLPLLHCSKYFNEYTSIRFKLNEINDLDTFYDELMKVEQMNLKSLNELTKEDQISLNNLLELNTYPAFKKSKFLNDKEKALSSFYNSMTDHIKANFNYPEKAMNANIQGKTNVTFIISSEGEVNEIYACNAHPLLQLEGIRIIGLLPKLIPGSMNGNNVPIRYSQPFSFKLQ
jgi:hypothetical protein